MTPLTPGAAIVNLWFLIQSWTYKTTIYNVIHSSYIFIYNKGFRYKLYNNDIKTARRISETNFGTHLSLSLSLHFCWNTSTVAKIYQLIIVHSSYRFVPLLLENNTHMSGFLLK